MQTKKTTILILIITVSVIVSGCVKQPVVNQSQNENQGDNQISTSTKEEKNNEVLKLTGQDENNWNIYKSEKYAFEIETPEKCKFINTKTYNKGVSYYFYFDCFVIEIVKNYYSKKSLQNKNELFQLLCDSPYIDNMDACISGREIDIKQVEIKKINNKNIIKTIEAAGLGSEVDMKYYLLSDDYWFSLSVGAENIDDLDTQTKNDLLDIVTTFKFVN